MRRRALLSYCALGLGAVAATLSVGWWQVDGPGAPETATAAGRPLPLTAMDFALTDHEGQPVGPETLIGQPSLVFFGFTWCPQVCPTTLADISHWLDGLDSEAETLATVLITVDPERGYSRCDGGVCQLFSSAKSRLDGQRRRDRARSRRVSRAL